MLNFKDLMDAAGGTFEPLPKTTVEAQITACEVATTQNGKTMFKITWSVIDGPYKNRSLWSNQVISPESPPALGIFFRQMAALGLDSQFFSTGPTPDQVAGALVGKVGKLTVDQREWNGSIRNEVKDIKKATGQLPGGGSAVPNTPPAPNQGDAPPLPF